MSRNQIESATTGIIGISLITTIEDFMLNNVDL